MPEVRDGGEEALAALSSDVAVLPTCGCPSSNGMQLFAAPSPSIPTCKVIIFTAYGRILSPSRPSSSAPSISSKGTDNEHILQVVRKAVASYELDSRDPRKGGHTFRRSLALWTVGTSPALQKVFSLIEKSPTPLFSDGAFAGFIGESGTGIPELWRRARPRTVRVAKTEFVHSHQLRCDSQDADGIELSGNEKGVFTGAVSQKPGRSWPIAARCFSTIGELALDEVVPARAARVRVRDGQWWYQDPCVDVRVIAATNRDPPGEAAAGNFP